MIRAVVTLIALVIMTVAVTVPMLIVGLVHPWPPAHTISVRVFSWVMLRVTGVDLEISGLEALTDGRPKLVMGNHQSALDIPILITALRGRVRFMAKDSLFKIPLFGWAMRRYGYASIDRRNPRETFCRIQRFLERNKRHPTSIAVFPEGTRTRDGRLLPFRHGAFNMGKRSGLDIVPFVINGSMDVQKKNRFRVVPGVVKLTFMDPIPASDAAKMSTVELHDVVRGAVERAVEPVGEARRVDPTLIVAAERT